MANFQLQLSHTTRWTLLNAAVRLFLCASVGNAAAQTAFEEQGQLIKSPNAIASIGTDLFGDSLNMYTGSLSFRQTDVSLRGNNALPVAVGRRFDAGVKKLYTKASGFAFGQWQLDAPYMKGIFSQSDGWTTGLSSNRQARCSSFGDPAFVSYGGIGWDGLEFWYGNSMYIPGGGEQQMLARDYNYSTAPNSAPASYPIVTADKWAIGCLPKLANDPGGTLGEGFVAISPEGVKYHFDQMVSVSVYSITKAGGAAALSAGSTSASSSASTSQTAPQSNALPGGTVTPMAPVNYTLPRKEVRLLVTLITDRFGNWVRYNYDPNRPANVTSITSSDGRSLTLSYNDANDPALVTSVTDGVRTWTYNYATLSGYTLSKVTLPDGATWDFANMYSLTQYPFPNTSPTCTGVNYATGASLNGSMTHPSGATGKFTLVSTAHGRSYVPQTCRVMPNGSAYSARPQYIVTYSLTNKTIAGPGMASMSWNYAYGPANASFSTCSGTCPTSKTVTVTDPKGDMTRYTFGNRYQVSEGRLEQVDHGWNGSTALSTTTTRYRAPGIGPYPATYGSDFVPESDSIMHSRPMPVDQIVTTQQGATFTWSANSFDTSARVTSATKSSSLGMSRTESTSYSDNLSLWVMDQVASVTDSGTGKVISANTYHPSTAMLATQSRFGKLLESYTYATDGTLYTKADGKSQTTTYTNYKAGLPQSTGYHDGTSESAVVTTNGYIMSMTNAAGYTTSFGYDAMGRPSSITYPTADTVPWNSTTIVSERVPSSEFGISGAHWRQTVSTGNARSITYYDGLLRPILNRTFDTASPSTTGTAVRKTFDHLGNVTFESYPLRDIADVNTAVNGITRSFDVLGRPRSEVAASELGNLTTSFSYGNPFSTTVTNPRGKSSTYTYYAWDQPSTDLVRTVAMPDSVNLTINRNTFGATTSMVRSRGAQLLTRRYVYDGFERLCKTIEPEVGATVQDYDLANNIEWKATGQNLPSTSSCDTASVPASARITTTYDGRNRPKTTTFGDGSPSIARTYTADGLAETVTSNGSVWTNTYNKRRLLERESLNLNGTVYPIDRTYDANGSLNTLKYPDSATTLTYAPNALGMPTSVGSYATAIAYHPNGAIASFNYGNGIAHSLTQNVRGLPRQSADAGVMSDLYDYDANANVTTITDQQEAVTTRTMGYDDLDRMTSVAAPSLWGTASYGYDGLDNLTSSTITAGPTARTNVHTIDPTTNRLTNVSSSNGAFAFGYGYDARGNITLRGSQAYVFDVGNRVSSATGKATYSYDGFGRRTVVAQTDGTNRRQVYGQDGKLYYASQTGGPQAASTVKYIYIGNHLLAEIDSVTGTQYAHTDALGSPIARTNSVKTVLSRTRYEPYGYVATGAVGKVGFTGHVSDTDTGLTYMQQRYYDSVAGRFLSVDPIVTDANSGKSFNRYSYANNSPFRYVDPDGRESVGEIIDRKATEAANSGNLLATYGWAYVGVAWSAFGAEGISQMADKGSSANNGDKISAIAEGAAVVPGGKALGALAIGGLKTIVETAAVVKKADALTGKMAASYEKIKVLLSQGKAGANQHALKGDLAGKSAADLGGSGKGRGAERVIFSEKENEVIIHDIVDYHKK